MMHAGAGSTMPRRGENAQAAEFTMPCGGKNVHARAGFTMPCGGENAQAARSTMPRGRMRKQLDLQCLVGERMREQLDPRCLVGECASSWIHDASAENT